MKNDTYDDMPLMDENRHFMDETRHYDEFMSKKRYFMDRARRLQIKSAVMDETCDLMDEIM